MFTSKGYGKLTNYKPGKDKPERILENTRKTLEDLKRQMEEYDGDNGTKGGEVGEGAGEQETSDKGEEVGSKIKAGQNAAQQHMRPLFSCKFNSGSFGVEWEDTRKVIEEVFEGSARVVHVFSPP